MFIFSQTKHEKTQLQIPLNSGVDSQMNEKTIMCVLGLRWGGGSLPLLSSDERLECSDLQIII